MSEPTHGDPHDDSSGIELAAAWDIAYGFRLRFAQRDVEYPRMSEIVITASGNGDGGHTKRDGSADQLEDFARQLLAIAAAHRWREAAR